MLKVDVIVGSTRPNRIGLGAAEWILERARGGGRAYFELIDVADFDLPLIDEPLPPSLGQSPKDHIKRWAKRSGRSTPLFSSPPSITIHLRRREERNRLHLRRIEQQSRRIRQLRQRRRHPRRRTPARDHGELQIADVRDHVALFL